MPSLLPKPAARSLFQAVRATVQNLMRHEDLNFLLTNRIPRRATTRFIGWFSKIKHPWVREPSIAMWKFFSDLDLTEAKKQHFDSMHDCFVRELKTGQRPIEMDPNVLVSPSDGIVGAHGKITGTEIIQAKGFPYTLLDLLGDKNAVETFRDGTYVTLRLTSAMYHRFHAPHDGVVTQVNYIAGDTWNVNPIALKRVEKLFCKNERAVLHTHISPAGHSVVYPIVMVPVAAILVASIRLHFLDTVLHMRYGGPHRMPCRAVFKKGQEMGWFQHGSTIIVFAPPGFTICADLAEGSRIRMGQALMLLPPSPLSPAPTARA